MFFWGLFLESLFYIQRPGYMSALDHRSFRNKAALWGRDLVPVVCIIDQRGFCFKEMCVQWLKGINHTLNHTILPENPKLTQKSQNTFKNLKSLLEAKNTCRNHKTLPESQSISRKWKYLQKSHNTCKNFRALICKNWTQLYKSKNIFINEDTCTVFNLLDDGDKFESTEKIFVNGFYLSCFTIR